MIDLTTVHIANSTLHTGELTTPSPYRKKTVRKLKLKMNMNEVVNLTTTVHTKSTGLHWLPYMFISYSSLALLQFGTSLKPLIPRNTHLVGNIPSICE